MIAAAARLAVLVLVVSGPAAPDGGASITIYVGDGGTQVQNKGSTWVSVTPNAGKTSVLAPGTRQDFAGASETQVAAAAPAAHGLSAPTLRSPSDKEKVVLKPTDKGLGPVVLTWTPVAAAKEYEVEFQVDNGRPMLLKVQKAEAKLPLLPPGKVAWAVRSMADGAQSEQSSRRWFELQADQLKLDAHPSGWK